MNEMLRREMALPCPPATAFRIFTEAVDLWWPRGHRRFRDGQLRFDGDRLIDRSAAGEEWTMAEIIDRLPPQRLHLAWFPGSPQAPTDVDIGFAADAAGTVVTIVHRALTLAAAEAWSARAATFGSGWDAVLSALAGAVESGAKST